MEGCPWNGSIIVGKNIVRKVIFTLSSRCKKNNYITN